MSDDTIEAYLAQHPRALGVAFLLLLVLGEAGVATVAANGTTTAGP